MMRKSKINNLIKDGTFKGHYEIEKELFQVNKDAVCRAVNLQTGDHVAVKRIKYSEDDRDGRVHIEDDIAMMAITRDCYYSVKCYDVFRF